MQVRLAAWLVVSVAFTPYALGQFGGRPGDAVIYVLTSNGSGSFSATSISSGSQRFKIVDPATVTPHVIPPYPFHISTLYEDKADLFELVTGEQNVEFQQRIYIAPVKLFQIGGLIQTPVKDGIGAANIYISFPNALDVGGDIDFIERRMLIWSPHFAPVFAPFEGRGPVGPPNISGYEYVFTAPGLIKLPFLLPWMELRQTYPSAGWQPGIDAKLLDRDPEAGNTTNLIRMRPGRISPQFSIGGDTHIFVLQGNVELTANSTTVLLKQGTYAFLPKDMTLRISNPAAFQLPGSF